MHMRSQRSTHVIHLFGVSPKRLPLVFLRLKFLAMFMLVVCRFMYMLDDFEVFMFFLRVFLFWGTFLFFKGNLRANKK